MCIRDRLKSDRIDIIKSVFENNEIVIAEPTSIQIPLSFNEGELFFFTEDDRADTEEFLSKFIDDFVNHEVIEYSCGKKMQF